MKDEGRGKMEKKDHRDGSTDSFLLLYSLFAGHFFLFIVVFFDYSELMYIFAAKNQQECLCLKLVSSMVLLF